MNNVTCPYCEKETEIDNDEGRFYDESNTHQTTCRNCEKEFVVSSYCSWTFEGHKADCLNGTEHDLEQMIGAPRGHFIGMFKCKNCDEIV